MKFRALSIAARELVEAVQWYSERSPRAADALVDEYERSVAEIKRHPYGFANAEFIDSPRDIRQCSMRKFPYVVYFEIAHDEVIVLAISHAARQTGYWLDERT